MCTVLLLSLDCRKSTHYECRVVVKIVFALKLCLKCRRVWSVKGGGVCVGENKQVKWEDDLFYQHKCMLSYRVELVLEHILN